MLKLNKVFIQSSISNQKDLTDRKFPSIGCMVSVGTGKYYVSINSDKFANPAFAKKAVETAQQARAIKIFNGRLSCSNPKEDGSRFHSISTDLDGCRFLSCPNEYKNIVALSGIITDQKVGGGELWLKVDPRRYRKNIKWGERFQLVRISDYDKITNFDRIVVFGQLQSKVGDSFHNHIKAVHYEMYKKSK